MSPTGSGKNLTFEASVTDRQAYLAGRMPVGFPWAAAFILSFGCFGFFFSFRLSLFPMGVFARFRVVDGGVTNVPPTASGRLVRILSYRI
jgi:hypothetical protein